MSLRTFTVFQDTPSADIAKPKAPTVTSSTLSTKLLNVNCATTITTVEKENVDPLTGERAGPTSTNDKKRKTSVLATKTHAPLTSKKQKESGEPSDSNPDAKKRKSSASSTLKLKAGGKKDGKTSSRKSTKKPSRRVSPVLPKVDEEAEAERVRERITQADVDSRCYELTVKPLADLSQAYEQGPSLDTDDDVVKFRSVKESSAEPELRDYFSPGPQSATLPLGSDGTSTLDSRTFSTPERKQIYAAFTFTSPSHTHEHFSKLSSLDSVHRPELL
ncbi:hypothetical protein C0993_001067 [Termitomyces sp. T159_Od127]|nr:hypothetical protein C0993_001067 [Termitomyces sp. T159_Od127]